MELAHPKKTNVNNTSPLVLITHYKQQAKNPNYSETGVCVCVCVCVCVGEGTEEGYWIIWWWK